MDGSNAPGTKVQRTVQNGGEEWKYRTAYSGYSAATDGLEVELIDVEASGSARRRAAGANVRQRRNPHTRTVKLSAVS